MSVKIMGQVWELDLPHNKLLVLLAMADHADHEGRSIYPSLELIAWKTGYEERQVRRIVRALESDGLLVVEKNGGGRHKPTEYSLHLEKGVKKSPFRRNPDIMTGNQEKHGQNYPFLPKKPGHYDSVYLENPDIMTPFEAETRTFEGRNPDIAMSPESYNQKDKEREKESKARIPKSEKTPKVRPSRSVPCDFTLTDTLRAWAQTEVPGVNLEYETGKFKDWEFKTPHTDWCAAWRNWMRRAWENLPLEQRTVSASTQSYKPRLVL